MPDRRAWFDVQKASLEQDTERLALFTKAISRVPMIADIEAALDNGESALVQAIGEEKGGSVQGIHVSQDLAAEVTSSKRQQSVPTAISGVYRVARVDATASNGFRVTLTNIETDEEITASLQDALVSDEHRALIQAAEWSKRPVRVRLSARLLRSRPIDAVILTVEQVGVENLPS